MNNLVADEPPELTIGIETDGGTMTPVIPRHRTLPTKKTHVLTTFWDKRTTVTIKVFEGERRETKDCRFLGQLELSGIPAARLGPRSRMHMIESVMR